MITLVVAGIITILGFLTAFEKKSIGLVFYILAFLTLFIRQSIKYEVLKYSVQQRSVKLSQEQVYNSSQKQLDEYIKIDGVYYDYRTKDELSEN